MITWVNEDNSTESPDYPNGLFRILFIIHNDGKSYVFYTRS